MLQGDLLDRGAHFHPFLGRLRLLQLPVEAPAADSCQLAHALDAQAALQRHHVADLLVDAVAPESPRLRRRASIFCKTPLKKSTSRVFSASSRLSRPFSRRREATRVPGRDASSLGSIVSSFRRHLYRYCRVTPNSCANAATSSQFPIRSTAIR